MNAATGVICIALLLVATTASAQKIEKFDPNAMHPESFASFDRDYLGGMGYFTPNALTINDLEAEETKPLWTLDGYRALSW